MKRILKSIVEWIYMVTACVVCPPIVVMAANKVEEDPRWSTEDLAYFQSRRETVKPLVINKIKEHDHEKPTTNPYATYLCINGNGG